MGNESLRQVVREIYCEVLFELAEESGKIDQILDDLEKVRRVLETEPEFASILNSLTVQGRDKSDSIRRVFSGFISDLALDFLSVLARRNRISYLSAIVNRYETMVDLHHKRYPVEVTVPSELNREQIELLRKRLSEALKSDVKLTVNVDQDLIGGIVIKKDDMVVDSSVRSALTRAARSVTEASRFRKNQPGSDQPSSGLT